MATDAYPHVDQVEDRAARQALRIIWDRIHDCERRLDAAEKRIEALEAEASIVLRVARTAKRHESQLRNTGSGT